MVVCINAERFWRVARRIRVQLQHATGRTEFTEVTVTVGHPWSAFQGHSGNDSSITARTVPLPVMPQSFNIVVR